MQSFLEKLYLGYSYLHIVYIDYMYSIQRAMILCYSSKNGTVYIFLCTFIFLHAIIYS